MSDRLAPTTTPDTKFFWDALKEGKLLIQRCAGCATLRHPPRPMCPRCNSLAWDTIESSGRGVVYSFVLPRHPPWPWFDGTYIVALVELEEGTRIVSNLCDVDPGRRDHRHAGAGLHRALRQRGLAAPVPPAENAVTDEDDARLERDPGRRSDHADADRRDRDGGGRRRHRDARLHAGAPRPRLRQLAGLAEHLHEHHDRQRLLQPLPDGLGRPRSDGAEASRSASACRRTPARCSSTPGTVTGKSQRRRRGPRRGRVPGDQRPAAITCRARP